MNLDALSANEIPLAAVILTHSHIDHAANAAQIKARYHTKIIISEHEAASLKSGSFCTVHGTTGLTKPLVNAFGDKLEPMMKYDPVDCDITVEDQYDLNSLGLPGLLIHTPGHSPGSMTLIVDDEIALVGDAMVGGSVYPPFAADPPLVVRSWKKLLETECSIFLPAHAASVSREQLQRAYEKYR